MKSLINLQESRNARIFLTSEDGAENLSRNVGKELPFYVA